MHTNIMFLSSRAAYFYLLQGNQNKSTASYHNIVITIHTYPLKFTVNAYTPRNLVHNRCSKGDPVSLTRDHYSCVTYLDVVCMYLTLGGIISKEQEYSYITVFSTEYNTESQSVTHVRSLLYVISIPIPIPPFCEHPYYYITSYSVHESILVKNRDPVMIIRSIYFCAVYPAALTYYTFSPMNLALPVIQDTSKYSLHTGRYVWLQIYK